MKNLLSKEELATDCWSLHYHIYDYLEKGGSLRNALEKWDGKRVLYFWNWRAVRNIKKKKNLI
jgi:hypothetical protein